MEKKITTREELRKRLNKLLPPSRRNVKLGPVPPSAKGI